MRSHEKSEISAFTRTEAIASEKIQPLFRFPAPLPAALRLFI